MYKSPLSCKEAKNCSQERGKNSNKFKMYADSHQFNTIVMCSHRDMLANPGIDERGGTVCIHLRGLGACCRKIFEIFVP